MSVQMETRPFIPALSPLHAMLIPLADPIVRLMAGGDILLHGIQKLMAGPAPVIASMAKMGIYPSGPFGYWIIFLESVGALAVILGLFTRFFSVCLLVEMLVIIFKVKLSHGLDPAHGGYEMFLILAGLFLALAFRGGGNYSADRAMGWEL